MTERARGKQETQDVTGGAPPREGVARAVAHGLLTGLVEVVVIGGVVAVVLGAAGGIGYLLAGGAGLLAGVAAGVLVLGATWVVLVLSGVATTLRAAASGTRRSSHAIEVVTHE